MSDTKLKTLAELARQYRADCLTRIKAIGDDFEANPRRLELVEMTDEEVNAITNWGL